MHAGFVLYYRSGHRYGICVYSLMWWCVVLCHVVMCNVML